MIAFSVKTIGIKSIVKRLQKHSEKIRNERRGLFLRLAVLGFKDIQQHFRDEASPSGGWKALSPITLKRRRKGKRRAVAKILQNTGNLRNSLMPNVGNKKLTTNSVILSTGGTKKRKVDTYAARHNFGLGRMPKREFMWISKQAKGQMLKQVREFSKIA